MAKIIPTPNPWAPLDKPPSNNVEIKSLKGTSGAQIHKKNPRLWLVRVLIGLGFSYRDN